MDFGFPKIWSNFEVFHHGGTVSLSLFIKHKYFISKECQANPTRLFGHSTTYTNGQKTALIFRRLFFLKNMTGDSLVVLVFSTIFVAFVQGHVRLNYPLARDLRWESNQIIMDFK